MMSEYKNHTKESNETASVGLTHAATETYRLFFLDDQSHIAAVQIVGAADEEAAKSAAVALLQNEERYQTAELWHFARRVAVLTR